MNTSSSFFRTLNTVGYAFLHLNINHYKASLTHSKKMATTCETKNSNFVTTNYKKKKENKFTFMNMRSLYRER